MINRGAIAVDDSGLIDVEQLEQGCTPCTGERQAENTNVPVEFRDASPLILGRYVTYLEQELARVREEKNQYIVSLKKQVEFLSKQVEELQRASKQHHKQLSHVLSWAMYIQNDVYDILPPVLLGKLKDRLIGLQELVDNLFAETDMELQVDIDRKQAYSSFIKPVFTMQKRQNSDFNVESKIESVDE
jgi:hypothetical protein